ncbi:MAG: F0F1 ATP synthase subunit epsilon [Bacteroidales bacterium]|nr:F0F1 ATP synthase subunit epsilon [Bacteroidales bacterium]
MHLEIISPEKILYADEITSVKLPGTVGYFELLNNHAPIVSTLAKGEIKVKNIDGVVEFFQIESGVAEAHGNKVSILVEL